MTLPYQAPGALPSSGAGSTPDARSASNAIAGSARLLRVFVTRALIVALAYAALTHGSKGGPVTPEPGAQTVSFTLGPSPIMYLIFAVICLGAFRSAERHTAFADPADPGGRSALDAIAAMLQRRLLLIVALAGVAWVAAMCWIALYPLEGWPQPNTWFFPFPFASVEMVGPS